MSFAKSVVVLILGIGCMPSFAEPCNSGTAVCAEWIELGSGRSLLYRTHPLDVRDESLTRALLVIHGGGRNADDYFRTGVAAALVADASENTVVIAPRFASNQATCADPLEPDEISWDCGAGSSGGWRTGSASVNDDQITSFDLADAILRKLAAAGIFPNLETITMVGYSAGGQFVNRYMMTNQIHESLRVPVSYVASSPSSYGYPDELRLSPGADSFQAYQDTGNCTTYDDWPYGLSNRAGYSSRVSEEQIRTQLASRPVTYLLSDLETPRSPALDTSCPAMSQGPSRLARGQTYFEYVTSKYGATHEIVVVPQCGHNSRCVLTADGALPILFPNR